MTTPQPSVLRLTTAGSVDDGKSTLIGRLLYACGALLDDQLVALEKQRSEGAELDLSLVTDGLKSEREQGITIDVAYKYFASAKRKFILADAPGHLQFTRNMVTAASRAQAAIILVDARYGLVEQTRRHAYLIHLLRVPHVIVAINKTDLIGYDRGRIEAIEREFRSLAWNVGHPSLQVLPVSALRGDLINAPSAALAWYEGPTLLDMLETIPNTPLIDAAPCLPVQMVIRSENGGRFAAGTLTHGSLRLGDRLRLLPTRQESTVAELLVHGQPGTHAQAGQAVALRLNHEFDLGRGHILTSPDNPLVATQSFTAQLVWFDEEASRLSERYLLRLSTQQTRAQIAAITHRFDLPTLQAQPAVDLAMNDIALVKITTAKPVFAAPYAEDRSAGAFVLIDPLTHRTVAAGLVEALATVDSAAQTLTDERTELAAQLFSLANHRLFASSPEVFPKAYAIRQNLLDLAVTIRDS